MKAHFLIGQIPREVTRLDVNTVVKENQHKYVCLEEGTGTET